MKLLNQNHKVSESLAQLLTYFSINPHHPLDTIVYITQKRWLQACRKQNLYHKTLVTSEQLSLFADLKMVNAIYPVLQKYDYILLLGSDMPDMRERIIFLDEQLKKGIQATKVVVLCSDRPLYDYEKEYTQTHTECQMIKELISKTNTSNWPLIEYCQAIGKTHADGSHQRATTEDTVKTWLVKNHTPGNCLIISQQPYVGRQQAVAQAHLKNNWHIETVGPQLAQDFTLEDMLDTLARWLYQEYQNMSK